MVVVLNRNVGSDGSTFWFSAKGVANSLKESSSCNHDRLQSKSSWAKVNGRQGSKS